jgi:hypothetical protein
MGNEEWHRQGYPAQGMVSTTSVSAIFDSCVVIKPLTILPLLMLVTLPWADGLYNQSRRKNELPDIKPMLEDIRIRHPIEQNMVGISGLFRQQNIEKRRVYSLREWFELGMSEDFRTPGADEVRRDLRKGVAGTGRKSRVKKEVAKVRKRYFLIDITTLHCFRLLRSLQDLHPLHESSIMINRQHLTKQKVPTIQTRPWI